MFRTKGHSKFIHCFVVFIFRLERARNRPDLPAACVCVPDQAYHTEAREVCPAQAWYTYTHTIQRGQTCLGTVQLLMSAPLMWKSEGGGGPDGLYCLIASSVMVSEGNYQSDYY